MNWYWNWINRMAERSTYALAKLFGSEEEKLKLLADEIKAREQQRLDQATILQKPLMNIFSVAIYVVAFFVAIKIYQFVKTEFKRK
jgi:hypothetical protein